MSWSAAFCLVYAWDGWSRVRLSADNFSQIDTFFDIPGINDHDPCEYPSHPNTLDRVWRKLAEKVPETRSRAVSALRSAKPRPKRRALLVGINDYPNPADRLEGCVNDVFLMSEVLQELRFEAEDIRVVLNERATAAGIRERLHWLLEETGPDDTRFLFYSGHGAQMPGYGGRGEVDEIDECLVPHDFDWSNERTVTDDWFCELYIQLPYDAQFIAVLDCCHSGGMTRNGARVRGLAPPDDIRHRSLRWDRKKEMWVPRDLGLAVRNLVDSEERRAEFVGDSGAVKRLGRGVPVWTSAPATGRRLPPIATRVRMFRFCWRPARRISTPTSTATARHPTVPSLTVWSTFFGRRRGVGRG